MSVGEYKDELLSLLNISIDESWANATEILFQNWMENKSVFVAGNGGNQANSLHFATDWNKGLFEKRGRPLLTHASGANPSLFSALENDILHDDVICRQIEILNAHSSVSTAVLLSASGSSVNMLRAARYCREKNIFTIGLTGMKRPVEGTFDLNLHVDSQNMQLIEDCHSIFGHMAFHVISESSL
jgi:phosphoheptose isomerase